jgi:hypothetical protein
MLRGVRMSDVSDGSGPVPRRTPRTTDGGAPVSGALAIVLAIVAVVAGFLIFRSISDDGDDDLGVGTDGTAETGDDTTGTTVPQGGSTVPQITVAPTAPAIVTEGATVVVANANGTAGSAASMKNALEAGPHFMMAEAEDASNETGVLATSVIYFDPAQATAQAVAQSLANVLGGGVSVLPLPGTPPVADGSIDGAGVLLMLGTDKANKTLEQLNPGSTTAVITNPPVVTSSTFAP